MPSARVKNDLLDSCLQRFSELRAAGRLFYDETRAETITDGGYVVSADSNDRFLERIQF
jgi:hypothetical protein